MNDFGLRPEDLQLHSRKSFIEFLDFLSKMKEQGEEVYGSEHMTKYLIKNDDHTDEDIYNELYFRLH